jgi:NosR/NirI family nitrous oxide reductase transcriptional regulator
MSLKPTLVTCACVLGLAVVAAQQPPPPAAPTPASARSAKLQEQMTRVFPAAQSFSAKQGDPPHFIAFGADAAGKPTPIGYVYWTTELEPLERGYDGPIKMLVGLDMKGTITGLVVAEHHEPYGNFSVETPAFANQFKGKSIRDGFKVGMDVDAVTRATITVTSAARAVKNASRRIARQYLPPPGK